MSKKKKKKRGGDAPLPSGGAGLIRFFQDESEGIKMGPVTITLLTIALIFIVIIAWARSLGLITLF